jgi:hypothetical protein
MTSYDDHINVVAGSLHLGGGKIIGCWRAGAPTGTQALS